jgi:hypothetical protein
VRQFQEDLRAGRLEPAWIEMAMNASARRRAGEFDGWKEREREVVWGIGGEPPERLDVGKGARDAVGDAATADEGGVGEDDGGEMGVGAD